MPRRPSRPSRRKDHLSRLREWASILYNQKPRSMMLLIIVIVNLAVLLAAAWVISAFALPGNTHMGFFTAVYNTVTMILDAGRIEAIIRDPGTTNPVLIIFCVAVIIATMITFTGALIGYVTNYISNIISAANTSSVRLRISDHFVILGWNNRASEIVNDLLYCGKKEKIVILADRSREEIIGEINERVAGTLAAENAELAASAAGSSWPERKLFMLRHKMKNNLTVIVREGDIFSSVQLNNIQLEKARSIVILGGGGVYQEGSSILPETEDDTSQNDNRTVKTLMQVIDITSRSTSLDDQKIVVEVENDWTGSLVRKIIAAKEKREKCRVVPFRVHRVMGQLLSQFSLMPDLNHVYRELFSNKGASFYAREQKRPDNPAGFVDGYLQNHIDAVPLTFIRDYQDRRNPDDDRDYCYYMAWNDADIGIVSDVNAAECPLQINRDYWIDEKHILILGSNSKMDNIMTSFHSYCTEWSNEAHPSMVHITVVDDEESLARNDHYRAYPFVEQCVSARINEENAISEAIVSFINQHPANSSILVLSDDTVAPGDTDAKTMTYLIYAREIIKRAKEAWGDDSFGIDIVAEIIDPKHVDIIRSYDVSNVVISNRYISKMITQLSESVALYNFFADIMTYDSAEATDSEGREIYVRRAGEYFSVLPPPNTLVASLIRAVCRQSLGMWGSEKDFDMLLGYIDAEKHTIHFFCGEQARQTVSLQPDDHLVIFSNHYGKSQNGGG